MRTIIAVILLFLVGCGNDNPVSSENNYAVYERQLGDSKEKVISEMSLFIESGKPYKELHIIKKNFKIQSFTQETESRFDSLVLSGADMNIYTTFQVTRLYYSNLTALEKLEKGTPNENGINVLTITEIQ